MPTNDLGKINIATDVIRTIAYLSASKVEGAQMLDGGIIHRFTDKMINRPGTQSIQVETGETEAAIDIAIAVDYGINIVDVAQAAQAAVKNAVEEYTGFAVKGVNVQIQKIIVPAAPVE